MILGRVDMSIYIERDYHRVHLGMCTFCFYILFFGCLQRKLKIEDETEFCSEDLLHTLLRCKVSSNLCFIFMSF